jgi:hypothetical protein
VKPSVLGFFCWLTADWVGPGSFAAAVKHICRAQASKVRSPFSGRIGRSIANHQPAIISIVNPALLGDHPANRNGSPR